MTAKPEHQKKDICPQCGEVKVRANKASITSWIFEEGGCKCARKERAYGNREAKAPKITIIGMSNCSRCGMLKRAVRPGSLTAWMFIPLSCDCPDDEPNAPQVALSQKGTEYRPEAAEFRRVPVNATSPELANIVIENRYKVLQQIGIGGMSAVYSAYDLKLEKQVALKFLLGHEISEAQIVRFQQEASVVAKMSHPNIIQILDFGLFKMKPYMVLELVEAPSILDVLQGAGPFTFATALLIFEQICDGMSHAHRLGVTHRDLKSSNVLLSGKLDEPKALILDFGICKWEQAQLTQQGEWLGSPIYMSPEQRRGGQVDGRSDIYSMGCLMFEVLCGRTAFSLEDIWRDSQAEPPRLIIENLGAAETAALAAMQTIIDRCLKEKPSERYQTMNELRSALSQVVIAQSVPKQEAPRPEKRVIRASRVVLLAVILGSGAILATMIFFTSGSLNLNKEKAPGAATTIFASDNLKSLSERSGGPLWIADVLDEASKMRRKKAQTSLTRSSVSIDRDAASIDRGSSTMQSRVLASNSPVSPSNFSYDSVSEQPSMSRTTAGMLVLEYPTIEYLKQHVRPNEKFLMLVGAREGVVKALPNCPLEWLIISNSKLSNADWERIEGFSDLNYFDLTTREKIEGKALKSVLKLKRLSTLGLSGGAVSDEFLTSLNRLPLRVLILEYNRNIDDRSVANLTKLAGLEQLWLSRTNISSRALESVAKMPGLRFVDLSSNESLTDDALRAISKMGGLQEIRIADCSNLTNKGIRGLSESLPNLKIVRTAMGEQKIGECKRDFYYGRKRSLPTTSKFEQVDDHKWQSRNPSSLETRALRHVKGIESLVILGTRKDIIAELAALPVKKLSLAYHDRDLGVADLRNLARIRTLEGLSLFKFSSITDADLEAIGTIKQLKELSLTSRKSVSAKGLVYLDQLPKLETLDLSYNSSVDDTFLSSITSLNRLRNLRLVHTNITSAGLLPVSKLSSLTTLDISANEQILDDGLRNLAKCQQLMELHCRGCRQVSSAGRELLHLKRPSLKVFTEYFQDYKHEDLYALKEGARLFDEASKASESLVPAFFGSGS